MDNDTFETPDLNFAAFLRARELEIVDLRREGNRVFWSFRIPEETTIRQLKSDWLSNGLVPAQTFSNALRMLKSSVFE